MGDKITDYGNQECPYGLNAARTGHDRRFT